MKKVIVLVGYYGSGKTSIVNFYPHLLCSDGITTEVRGFLSIGGKRGADDFKRYKVTKKEFFEKLFLSNRDYLIHGALFSNRKDFFYYSRNHEVIVMILDTVYEELKKRVLIRNAKSKINLKKYVTFEKGVSRLVAFCQRKKYKTFRFDNNREFGVVAREVWETIISL